MTCRPYIIPFFLLFRLWISNTSVAFPAWRSTRSRLHAGPPALGIAVEEDEGGQEVEVQVQAVDFLPGSHLFPVVRDGRQPDAHQGQEDVRFYGVT